MTAMDDYRIFHSFEEIIKRHGKYCDAVNNFDVLGTFKIFHEEMISHLEDLVDEVSDPKMKTEMLLGLVELKNSLNEHYVAIEAVEEYRKGRDNRRP
jgi:hypothetical protein